MNVTLYGRTFNFHKVVRQQNSGAVEDFILPHSALYLRIQKWKNYLNRSTFAKVIVKIKVAPFLMAHGVHPGPSPAVALQRSSSHPALTGRWKASPGAGAALMCISSQHGSVNGQCWANATTDKIVSVVHGNCDFDPIRFRAKIAIFDFDSIIVTSLQTCSLH